QEFIRRFALHILPKGFTRIRHYGILSSSWKKEKLPELQAALATKKSTVLTTEKPILHRRCPSCKKGKLHTVLLFDARGPPTYRTAVVKPKTVIRNTEENRKGADRNGHAPKLETRPDKHLKATHAEHKKRTPHKKGP